MRGKRFLAAAAGILMLSQMIVPVSAAPTGFEKMMNDVVVARLGYADMNSNSRLLDGGSAFSNDNVCWDQRKGVVAADVADLDQDGRQDLVVYYFGPSKASKVMDKTPTALYVSIFSSDGSKIREAARRELFADSDVGFSADKIGFIDVGGRTYILHESNGNAYFANGAGIGYTLLGFADGEFRPIVEVGKSDGGSSGIAYSIMTYTDAQNYSKQVLWADSEYTSYSSDQVLTNGDVGNAIIAGFLMVGLPEAKEITEPNSNWGVFSDRKDVFPTFWGTQAFRPHVIYYCSGEGDYSTRNMTVTVKDETGTNPNPGSLPANLGMPSDAAPSGNPSDPQSSSSPQFGTGTVINDEPAPQAQASEYLFEDADKRFLTDQEVRALSLQALNYAKNEIYARHGRRFNSTELQEYFGSKSWYNGTISPDSFSESVFNSYEKKNIEILKNAEYSINSNGYPLDQPGYDINAVGTASGR